MAASAQRSACRNASHAGSWYSSSPTDLSSQLDGWLEDVPSTISTDGTGKWDKFGNGFGRFSDSETPITLPVAGARIVIAPHAGYAYSGPAAAWAYRCWDVSKAKRVFLLGPSHHHYTPKAALSKCTHYETPLGRLKVDQEITAELSKTGHFEWMSQSVDEAEHSLEMHLPYIFKTFERTLGPDIANHPVLVPIMIGNTNVSMERKLARALAPYLDEPETAWVISSDFAHWGLRFRYTYYRPTAGEPMDLNRTSRTPKSPEIHESIRLVDFECMDACEAGNHTGWTECLEQNENTVCGRHPIAVMLATLEELRSEGHLASDKGRFSFVRYQQSSKVLKVSDESVSYASAFAVL